MASRLGPCRRPGFRWRRKVSETGYAIPQPCSCPAARQRRGDLETEFRSRGPQLNAVAVLQARRSIYPLAVDERSVPAHQVAPVCIEPDLSVSLSPDHDLAKPLKRDFLHLIGLRPTPVTNDDTRHAASLFARWNSLPHLSLAVCAMWGGTCATPNRFAPIGMWKRVGAQAPVR